MPFTTMTGPDVDLAVRDALEYMMDERHWATVQAEEKPYRYVRVQFGVIGLHGKERAHRIRSYYITGTSVTTYDSPQV